MRHIFICIHLFFSTSYGAGLAQGAFVILDQIGAVEVLDYLGETDEPSQLSATFQPGNVAIMQLKGRALSA